MSNETVTPVLNDQQVLALQQFQIALKSLQSTGVIDKTTNVELQLPKGINYTVPPEAVDLRSVIRKERKGKKPAPSHVNDFIKWFITAPEADLYKVTRGGWECVPSTSDDTAHVLNFHSRVKGRHDSSYVICVRPKGATIAIFNASNVTYGTGYAAQKRPQQVAEDAGAVPVPFLTVAAKKDEKVRHETVSGAGCDLTKLKLLDWKGSEKLIIPPVKVQRWEAQTFNVINRHFAGAAVVASEGKYFLFDADRNELEFHNFNPFFAQLPHKVGSVAEAYEALKPQEVKDAEKAGRKVIRQGEFFFVETTEAEQKRIRGFIGNEAQQLGYTTKATQIELLEKDAILVGAALYNCNARAQVHRIESFIEATKTNDGKLDKSDINAKKALTPAIERLSVQVGPKAAQIVDSLMQEKPQWDTSKRKDWTLSNEDCASKRYGDSHTVRCLPDEFNQAAQLRLDSLDAWDSDSRQRGTKNEYASANVRYASRIGKSRGANDRSFSNNAHICTVVVQNPKDEHEAYAIGCVIHSGREHNHIYLDGWYKVVPNTATNNWTVSGDVD